MQKKNLNFLFYFCVVYNHASWSGESNIIVMQIILIIKAILIQKGMEWVLFQALANLYYM